MKCIHRKGAGTAALGLAMAASGLSAGTAVAQEGADALEEVVVTARKREESLLDIPVAVTAFNASDILAADLSGLDDIGNLTAGFQFFNQGNQQPGRYNTQLQFRGLTTSQFSPSFALGALFIDGVYVLNGGTSLSLMDLERVEVIKGPQAAYFGRNTFGGAVNLVTRDPNLQEFAGEVNVTTTTRSNNDYNAFVEGPIIRDRLGFSLGARLYDKKGHYVADDGGRLGNEETTTINGVLFWVPTDNLEVKLRYGYSEDDDGAPAQGFVSGVINDNCTGRTIQSPEGPANPQRYICGQVPDINAARADIGRVVSANSFLGQNFIDVGITNPDTNLPGLPQVDDVGLKRETERLSLAVSYDWRDYTVDFIAASNEQDANWIRDFDLSNRPSWFSRDPQQMEDESFEIRLTSPQDGRLRWLVGANYYEQEFTSSGGGGDAATSCISFITDTLTDDYSTCIPGLTLLFPTSLQDSDTAEVTGFFGSVDFDLTDEVTLIVEGRYQEDKFTKGRGLTLPGAPVLEETFDGFLPRVIARWQPVDETTLYASYSEGQVAGDFNAFFINADDRERAQYLAQDPNVTEALPAEELTAFEIGWKQVWLDGRLQTSFAAYYYEWENIKGRSSFQINETCRPGEIDATPGCDSAIGQQVGDPKRVLQDPSDPTSPVIPFFNGRNILLPGDATVQGLELETLFQPVDGTTIVFNLSYIDSEYDDYLFNFVAPIAGFSQMAGNQTPRQPKWQWNTSVTQDFTVAGLPAFIRGDVIYQGRSYVDESNLAYIDDYTLVNLRGGIELETWRVELFVRNLLDEDAWMTGARWTDFSSPFQSAFFTSKQGVAVSPQDKREVGLRVNFMF